LINAVLKTLRRKGVGRRIALARTTSPKCRTFLAITRTNLAIMVIVLYLRGKKLEISGVKSKKGRLLSTEKNAPATKIPVTGA
jgi:uncharacterized membrane protein YidH (DUF202 family)